MTGTDGASGAIGGTGASGSTGVGDTRTVAVVPLRGGTAGKSRLSRRLGASDRSSLVVLLARHVVAALVAADGVAEVVVVSADAAWAGAALDGVGGRVRVVPQPADRPGLDAAVDVGREAAASGARSGPSPQLLVVHADLPALTPDDVAALLAANGPLVVAADRLGTGTNALRVPADAPFRTRFGPGSLAAHRAEGARRGLPAVVVHRPGTAVDLDTPEDWAALPATVRRRLVRDLPALDRLNDPVRGPRAGTGDA